MFGGANAVSGDADTWQWNGSHWQQLASAPGPRELHAMAYDRAHEVTIAFGGSDGSTDLRDTILFDGSSWSAAGSGSLPATVACSGLAGSGRKAWMVYDEAIAKAVLFRGVSGTLKSATYTWDGQTWNPVTTVTTPPARLEAALAYDAAHGRVVLFGGVSCQDGSRLGDTWLFDGTNWTQANPADSPTRRTGASMTYDERTQRVILFGGLRVDGALGDTWAWDGTNMNWTSLALPITPDPRYDATLAFDAVRANLVLYGGTLDTGAFTSEVWTYRFHSAAFPPDTCQTRNGRPRRRHPERLQGSRLPGPLQPAVSPG